jgi:hypothetical protein
VVRGREDVMEGLHPGAHVVRLAIAVIGAAIMPPAPLVLFPALPTMLTAVLLAVRVFVVRPLAMVRATVVRRGAT